jgi:fructosamine-3-kinase
VWHSVAASIADATGNPFKIEARSQGGGGCINQAWVVRGLGQTYFVKVNQAELLDMFVAEMAGLQELQASATLRVPCPVCYGTIGDRSFLVLEYLDFGVHGDSRYLGTGLASMHRSQSRQFGWERDNTIGSTPQHNTWTESWVEFWREKRLQPQLGWLREHGMDSASSKLADQLLRQLPGFFEDYQPEPSLLHGDLWSGNYGFDTGGMPVLFDPAVYYGDRETDIAMTELFGGFSQEFYQAYQSAWPLHPGYPLRRPLYNLYHLLNHANLFGGGYLGQVRQTLQLLLSQR